MPGTFNSTQTIGSGTTSFDVGTYVYPTTGTNGSAVFAAASAVPTLINAGTLKGNFGFGNGVYGVSLAGVGTVINTGTIITFPGFRGIDIAGSAAGSSYVSNSGTVDLVLINSPGRVSNAAGGTMFAGVSFTGGHAGSLDNAGTITSQVLMTGSGTVTNTGVISQVSLDGTGMITNASQIGVDINVAIQANDGTVVNQAGGLVTGVASGVVALGSLSVLNAGTINGGTSGFSFGVYLSAGGSVTNSQGGRIAARYGIEISNGAGTVVDSGAIAGNTINGDAILFAPGYDNLLSVNEGASFKGRVDGGNTLGATSTSTLEFASGSGSLGGIGTLGVAGATVVNFANIEFSPGAAWTIAGSSSVIGLESITGFTGGDAIDVQGGGLAKSVSVSGETVSLFTSPTPSGVPFFTFTHLTGVGGATLNPADIGLLDDGAGGTLVACFAAGTRIATPRGEVAVEDLTAGEHVVSRFGGVAPVRWIGRRRIDLRRHPRPREVWPVRVIAGAFGPGLPARDVYLSPDHAVFVAGTLIPVRYLINGTTVAQQARDGVEYFHVELPAHDVLLAEGLACESYLETGNRGAFDNGGAPLAATGTVPDLAPTLSATRRARRAGGQDYAEFSKKWDCEEVVRI